MAQQRTRTSVTATRMQAARLALAMALGGCGVVRDDVDALLARGEPVAALGRLQAQTEGVTPRARARYRLRRGLAHLGLGDTEAARLWLAQARDIVDQDPSALGVDDRARLLDAVRGTGDPLHASRLLYRRAP